MEESEPLPRFMPDGKPWPRISIVTPSYHQGQFIEETIRSVLLQGYPNLEYIVIDGGSTDHSVEIIKKYQPWLAYWVSEPDSGQARALNKGFERATGEIYAYLNSDDLYAPGCLQRVATDFSRDETPTWHAYRVQDFSEEGPLTLYYAPLISDGFIAIPQDSHALQLITGENPIDWNELLPWVVGKVHLHQPGVFWPSELHQEAGGFDERFHYQFDRKFFMELVARNHALKVHQEEPCALFRLHDKSKTVATKKEWPHPSWLEGAEISKEFEALLNPKDRWRAQSVLGDVMISEIWESYVRNTSAIRCLRDLIALPIKMPAVLSKRFFWGSIRKMLLGKRAALKTTLLISDSDSHEEIV